MKKLIAFVVFAFTMVMFGAAGLPPFPGYKASKETLQAHLETIKKLDQTQQIVLLREAIVEGTIALMGTNPSYAEALAEFQKLVAAKGIKNDAAAVNMAITYIVNSNKDSATGTPVMKEAYAAAKATNRPNMLVLFIDARIAARTGLSETEHINVVDTIIKQNYKVCPVGKLKYGIESAIVNMQKSTFSESEQAAMLKSWNRILSVTLVCDKKKDYEPIIALIRTALATY